MKLDFCALCGSRELIHHHHIVPRSLGGSDEPENMLTLCALHHGELHKVKLHDMHVLSVRAIKQRSEAERERMRAVSQARGRLQKAKYEDFMSSTVLPFLRSAFPDWPPKAQDAVAALNSAGIWRLDGGEWQIGSLKKRVSRSGVKFRRERHPYLAWVAEYSYLAKAILDAGCLTYAAAALALEKTGIVAFEGPPWTETKARRFLRAAGSPCPGPAGTIGSHKLMKPWASIRLDTDSPHMQQTYMIDWRNFCRWRGHEEVPATHTEMAEYLEYRIQGCRYRRAQQIVSALGHVHQVLGGERIALWPEVRHLMKQKRTQSHPRVT